ncbi:surface-adhesin E family protein, partial [Burkholderia sp. SIMBA_052]|uniref:surface-adhesin E family protein n=1 Tax=Burkholderia sp. SIMBA_052 TaxID=3085793 RepID=UPI00397C7210
LIGAAIFALSAVASASTWQQISRNVDGDVLIDRDSIVRSGDVVKVWLMQFHVAGKQSPSLREPIYGDKQQWLLNCATRSIAVGQVLLTGKNGD